MSSNIKMNDEAEIKSNYQFELQNSPTLMTEFYADTIKQSELIMKNAIFMIWIGILLIISSFVVYTIGITNNLIVGTLAGSFIDIFSGTILYLFNKADKDKQEDFNNLSKMETYKRYMQLIESIKDENMKKEMIEKLLDKSE